MNKKYNWAVLGCGKIARKFARDLSLLPQVNLYAAASRELRRAKDFASDLGFEKAYGNYEEMLADPNVDVVYIATPHSHHYQHTMLCLEHKKAVLCEKAFSLNAVEVKEMTDCAKANNTFLMEAFWTAFQPSFRQAMEIVNSGELGELKVLRSDFAFNAPFLEDKRLYNVALGGGSLLDIGIYPVFAALSALGIPASVKTFADFSSTGAEESISMIFKYPGGKMANLTSSLAAHSPIQTEYWCEKGYVLLNPRWFTPTDITVVKAGEEPVVIPKKQSEGSGYQYEAVHVMECLDKGWIESTEMPWQRSIDLMQLLDRIRNDAGISFGERDKHLLF